MDQRFRRGFTAAEKTQLWDRWQRGESLKAIGRAFGKPSSSIYYQVAPHGGIRPPPRRRSRLALTLAEREEISRGRRFALYYFFAFGGFVALSLWLPYSPDWNATCRRAPKSRSSGLASMILEGMERQTNPSGPIDRRSSIDCAPAALRSCCSPQRIIRPTVPNFGRMIATGISMPPVTTTW